MSKTTIASLSSEIVTEGDAYAYLENLRWKGSPFCSHCHSDNVYLIAAKNGVSRKTRTGALTERRVWKCRQCGKQFSVLTGTILHGMKVSVRTFVLVFFDFMAAKNGISAREVERKYGVCPRTAWFLLQRIRHAMAGEGLAGTLRGTIVADETWYGGAIKNWHNLERGFGRQNIKTDKQPIMTLINADTREVRSRVVPDVTGASLSKVLSENVDMAASILHTDEAGAYTALGRQFQSHQTVNHSVREYVRGSVSTNKAENFFSQLKRSLDGTHHHVSREHLLRYLQEFGYRWETCKMPDAARMGHLAGQMEGRLTYKRVKAS